MYVGLLAVRPACPACKLDPTRFDTGDGPALAMTSALGAIIMAAVLWVEFQFNLPAWVHLVTWPTVTIPAAVLLMRPLKAALIVQSYRHRAVEMEQ